MVIMVAVLRLDSYNMCKRVVIKYFFGPQFTYKFHK